MAKRREQAAAQAAAQEPAQEPAPPQEPAPIEIESTVSE
jgi:hypothetical protein